MVTAEPVTQARVLNQRTHSMGVQIPIPLDRIADFCRRHHIVEFSLFGSVLRPDFRADSDVDVLVAYESGYGPTLEESLDMEDELQAMFGREIDLVERRLIENPFRRYEILTTRQVIYTANSPTNSAAAVAPDPGP